MFLRVDTAGGVILEEADKTEFHESGLWYGLLQNGRSKWYSAFGILRIAEVDKQEWDRLKSIEAGKTQPQEDDGSVTEDEAERYRKYVMGIGNKSK